MLGKCHCSLPFSYTFPRTSATVHCRNGTAGWKVLWSHLIQILWLHSMLLQLHDVCRKEKIVVQLAHSKEIPPVSYCWMPELKDQIVRGRVIFLCRVMTFLCARRKKSGWQELWFCFPSTTRQIPLLQNIGCITTTRSLLFSKPLLEQCENMPFHCSMLGQNLE